MRPRRALPAFAAAGLIAASQLAAAQPAAAAALSCSVDYSVTNQWDTGFGANVTVKNVGTAAISGWNVTWTYQDGQRITQLWNGVPTQNGTAVSVKNVDWNANIPAAGSAQF